jgi:lipopolysaccharide export system permease protein
MRLLDRYLLRELLIPLGYCLGGFLIFWVAFDLLSELSSFQERNISAREIVFYYIFTAPELLVVIMPIALLLALLYSLTNLARHNELTGMRAAGLSLARLSVPYFGVGVAFSLILFLLNELCAPKGDEAARNIVKRHGPGPTVPDDRQWFHNLHFRNGRDGRIWNIEAFNTVTSEMRGPHVEWNMPDGVHRLIARSAGRSNDCWVFFDVQEIVTSFDMGSDPAESATNNVPCPSLTVAEFSETPQQIKSEIKISRLGNLRTAKDVQLSIFEILDYVRLHPNLGSQDAALLYTKLQERLAAPWTCVVVVLIALPFGGITARRNVFAGVACSVFICFSFFVLLRLGAALGTGGYIPSWLAAWLPNALFAGVGLWLCRRAP